MGGIPEHENPSGMQCHHTRRPETEEPSYADMESAHERSRDGLFHVSYEEILSNQILDCFNFRGTVLKEYTEFWSEIVNTVGGQ